eukprot:TRINITY_DN11972_c0_g1_i2.p1 TRINITY_DN11972_c0_g1~~TRINITY_DN11972_c0_g1_i2.p1  ORF type:complete len:408 (+),score=21.73 TRINITY_DN11972_c0_g1_i2:83-1306(+)
MFRWVTRRSRSTPSLCTAPRNLAETSGNLCASRKKSLPTLVASGKTAPLEPLAGLRSDSWAPHQRSAISSHPLLPPRKALSQTELQRSDEEQWEREFRVKLDEEFRRLPTTHAPSSGSRCGESRANDEHGDFHVGSEIRLRGLRSSVALNGLLGKCVKWHAGLGRWEIVLENDERVLVKSENMILRDTSTSSGSCCHTASSFHVGDHVTLSGLRARPELNGVRGQCTRWDDCTRRWDVRIEDRGNELLRVRPENLSDVRDPFASAEATAVDSPRSVSYESDISVPLDPSAPPAPPSVPALQSNNGWTGKSVHSWIFGDAQEFSKGSSAPFVVTIHTSQSKSGERVSCTSLGGFEIAGIDRSLSEITFQQINDVVTRYFHCDAGDIQLLGADSRPFCSESFWSREPVV